MAMDSVLSTLESKIEELIAAHDEARKSRDELQAKVEKLETQLSESGELTDKVAALEQQRTDLAARLEKVLEQVDATLKAQG
jgi:chromosome segregation ATPase